MRSRRPLRDLVLTFVTFVFALSLGCMKKPEAKHYPMQGRIISVDKLGHQLIIDHAAIPGFMEAMTMPYSVADKAMLEQVKPGDEIKADLRVEGEHIVIEKLEVVKKASVIVPEREKPTALSAPTHAARLQPFSKVQRLHC
jgi:Cu/Ag efflux protein CusF